MKLVDSSTSLDDTRSLTKVAECMNETDTQFSRLAFEHDGVSFIAHVYRGFMCSLAEGIEAGLDKAEERTRQAQAQAQGRD